MHSYGKTNKSDNGASVKECSKPPSQKIPFPPEKWSFLPLITGLRSFKFNRRFARISTDDCAFLTHHAKRFFRFAYILEHMRLKIKDFLKFLCTFYTIKYSALLSNFNIFCDFCGGKNFSQLTPIFTDDCILSDYSTTIENQHRGNLNLRQFSVF